MGDFVFRKADWGSVKRVSLLQLFEYALIYMLCVCVVLLPDILDVSTKNLVTFFLINFVTHCILCDTKFLAGALHLVGDYSCKRTVYTVCCSYGMEDVHLATVIFVTIIQTMVDQIMRFTVLYYTAKLLLFGG